VKLKFSETPTWLLFLLSITPMLFGELALKYWSFVVIAITIFFALWAYSVTKELTARNKYAPAQNFGKFRRALIIGAAYVTMLFLCLYFNGTDEVNGWILVLILVGQFILLYCFIYLLIFISRSIAILEFQKPVGFSEFAGYFFCLFFFPIGIWWVNAKIRYLIRKEEYEFN
jgi:hypothetical protein